MRLNLGFATDFQLARELLNSGQYESEVTPQVKRSFITP